MLPRAPSCAPLAASSPSNITLTQGLFIGGGQPAADRLIQEWATVTDRTDEVVPRYGFTQAEREVASAGRASG